MVYQDFGIDYDTNTTLVGDISILKDFVSHELGTDRIYEFKVSNFRVYAEVGGTIVEVTKSLSSIELASLQKAFNDEVEVLMATSELDVEECA